jgi:hypothetical protein
MNFLHATAPAGVAVTVSARLHLGFLDLKGESGRRFGSLGLSISEPRGRLTLRRASAARVRWPDWGSASRGATRSGAAVRALAERRRSRRTVGKGWARAPLFDASLKQRRLNPGATADLTVATLFVRRLRDFGLPDFSPDVLRSQRNND